jgi:hypothetical protein
MTYHDNDKPCWRIVLADGSDYDPGDGVPHFRTEQRALAAADVVNTAEAFPKPCVTVTCDGCEADLEGDIGTLHFLNGAEAGSAATALDWTVTDDGRFFCEECTAERDDEDEPAEIAATP